MPRKKIPAVEIDAAYQGNAFRPFSQIDSKRKSGEKGASQIMYIENKSESLAGGEARIGRVTFSKTGRTIYYQNRGFSRFRGYKANFRETATGDYYWISGPKKDGSDRLYQERVPVEIDEDVREEYWTTVRNLPEKSKQRYL